MAHLRFFGFVELCFVVFFIAVLFVVAGYGQTGNTPVSSDQKGKVSICKEIDDDWKCVGESTEWPSNKSFKVLFINPVGVKGDFIGIIIHKQGPDGKDVSFVTEYQQNIGDGNRKYATVGDEIKLPAGVYSVYILSWDKHETLIHKGNFMDYLAKTTLTVK
jgi:hypothetical protein